MEYCIAMAAGFLMGVGSVLATVIALVKEDAPKRTPTEIAQTEIEQTPESLNKQWANFLNYDGTSKGQTEIGGE